MDSMNNLFGTILGMVSSAWFTISNFLFDYRIIIGLLLIFIICLWRLILANLLYVERNDKRDWIIWGITFVLGLCICFIPWSWLWLICLILIISFIIFYSKLMDNYKQFKTVLYSSGNVMYDDVSDKYDVKTENSNNTKERKDAKNHRIKRTFSTSRLHFKFGMPIFVTKFTFIISPTSSISDIAKLVQHLNSYFPNYNWRHARHPKGKKYEISAELKVDKNLIVPFDKEISDELDWYVVPLGAIDVSNKRTAKETPYVWMMHDPKDEGKSYEALKKTNTTVMIPAPQAFVIGASGGGKSVLLNSMISHWVNKAKSNSQTELWLIDPKRVEFRPYESLKEIAGVAVSIDEAIDLTDRFRTAMLERNAMMEKEGMKKIPLDGKVSLKKYIDINGHLIYGKEVIEFKTANGQISKDYAYNLRNRTDIIEVNIPDEKDDKKEEENKNDGMFW